MILWKLISNVSDGQIKLKRRENWEFILWFTDRKTR